MRFYEHDDKSCAYILVHARKAMYHVGMTPKSHSELVSSSI
jgi:hypothetical protein